jgi:hypothetical protein
MRYKTRTVLAFCGIVATVAVAVSLAFVSGGRAASPNVCLTPTPPGGTTSSCVTQIVTPHFISPPGTDGVPNDAISITKFLNESGASGATATHLVIGVSFTNAAGTLVPVKVKSIALVVNGSSAGTTGCSPALDTSATSVSCPAGNIAGNGTVKLTVRFSTSVTLTPTGSVAYGEGPGNPSNPPNDFQVDTDSLPLTVSADGSAGGGCFDILPGLTQTVTGRSTDTLQATSAKVGQGAGSLPCTFVDAGVRDKTTSALAGHTKVSFVEFPTFLSGYATVAMILTPVPAGFNLNKSPVFEDTSYAAPYFQTYITVPNCDKAGNIVGAVGTPPPGAKDPVVPTDPVPPNDTCIFNRSSLPKGAGEIDMHVIGSPADGSYQG